MTKENKENLRLRSLLTGDGAAQCCSFRERQVWSPYGMFKSVTQMLEQLTWILLSKKRKNSHLILFYKIINNLATYLINYLVIKF